MPFTDRLVTVQGRRVGYLDEGTGGAVPLVLLHGGGFDHAELSWKLVTPLLATARRVIVPDLPGYGQSEGIGHAHDLADLGRWLIAFLDALGLARVDLSGVSMGGGMVLWGAINHPERIRRLVPVCAYGLMNRVGLHPLAAFVVRSGLTRLVYAGAAHSRVLARLGLSGAYGNPARVTDDAVEDLRAVAREQGKRRSFDAFLAQEIDAKGLRSDLSGEVHRIEAPTLLIFGAHDRIIPARHGRKAADVIPDARILVMETGHWPMREQPEAFASAVTEFLDAP